MNVFDVTLIWDFVLKDLNYMMELRWDIPKEQLESRTLNTKHWKENNCQIGSEIEEKSH